MSGSQDLRNAFGGAFRFLIHGELVWVNRLIFVDSILNVPAREVATISSREGTCAESADRGSLPVTIVDMSAAEGRLFRPCIGQRQTNSTLPSGFGNGVSCKREGRRKENDR